ESSLYVVAFFLAAAAEEEKKKHMVPSFLTMEWSKLLVTKGAGQIWAQHGFQESFQANMSTEKVLWYPRDSPFELEAYSDNDYEGANLDRKSTTGGCQFLRRRLISWQCKKQTIVANSTTEAEYVAAANCYLLTKGFDVTRFNFLVHLLDSKEYTITEASVRSKLQLANATGIHNLSDAKIYAGLATLGYVTEGAAVDQGEGSTQPAEPHHTPIDPISSISQPPIPSPHPSPPSYSPHQSPLQSPPHSPHQSPPHSPPFSPPHFHHLGPMKHLSLKSEEPEDQGRIIQDINDDPLVSLVKESMKKKSTDFVTPTKASREAQEEEISPTILETAKTLSKVASQSVSKAKSTDKGKRYRRRARSMAKRINTGLDAEEEINTGIEEVSTGSAKVDSGTASKRGQREGKAPMVEEDIQATHKTKEQIRQEEVGLEEAIKLQAQMDEEKSSKFNLEAQYNTEEDWDANRAIARSKCSEQTATGKEISNPLIADSLLKTIRDMMPSSPICLLSKASKTKSWLWHRRLSYLNFEAINHLARHGLVRGLPKLKFEKDHLCSACALRKSTKKPHKPKSKDTNQEKLYLLHLDLCGPMHVTSVNGKKYILVIVDDYSRFTWVKYLRSKDEAPAFIINFLKMIQVRLKETV
ncbi:retrovirus-related pol polyprotein from transposon TNT 1-94, partial [Tanacetum coccineum]